MAGGGIVEAWAAAGAPRAVGGHELFVIDRRPPAEEAPPVLVLHGFPTSGADWHHAVAALGERRRVVVPDLLGYGLSEKPDRAYSLFAQADLVAALVADLGIETVALVTHDMGDSVGGELLARSVDGALPFTIERRVLTNGSIYLDLAQLTDGQKLLRSLPDAPIVEELVPTVDVLVGALQMTLAPDARCDADLRAMAALVVHRGGNRLLARLIRYIDERAEHEHRWTGAIETHPAPLAVIWGDLDPIARFAMVERLLGRRADARLHRLGGVGHYPMVEAPERFNEAVRAALA
jgi:pimeloyl-ACP methyl ester carboxylesterase